MSICITNYFIIIHATDFRKSSNNPWEGMNSSSSSIYGLNSRTSHKYSIAKKSKELSKTCLASNNRQIGKKTNRSTSEKKKPI